MDRVPLIGQERTFDVQCHDTPMAYPSHQLVPHATGATLNIFGGLSKFEFFVGQAIANPVYATYAPAEILERVQSVCAALEGTQKGITETN